MTNFLLNHVAEIIFMVSATLSLFWVDGKNRAKEFGIFFLIETVFFLIYVLFIYKKYGTEPLLVDEILLVLYSIIFSVFILWSDKIRSKKKKTIKVEKKDEN